MSEKSHDHLLAIDLTLTKIVALPTFTKIIQRAQRCNWYSKRKSYEGNKIFFKEQIEC